jgi:hypothetical protein
VRRHSEIHEEQLEDEIHLANNRQLSSTDEVDYCDLYGGTKLQNETRHLTIKVHVTCQIILLQCTMSHAKYCKF